MRTFTLLISAGAAVALSDVRALAEQPIPGPAIIGREKTDGPSMTAPDYPRVKDIIYTPNVYLYDERDDTEYPAQHYFGLDWMTANLKYSGCGATYPGSFIPDFESYGRLYPNRYSNDFSCCPSGWRLPRNEEFSHLFAAVTENLGSNDMNSIFIANSTLWETPLGNQLADGFGFNVLPAGKMTGEADRENVLIGRGKVARMMTVEGYVEFRTDRGASPNFVVDESSNNWSSVRCVRDAPKRENVYPMTENSGSARARLHQSHVLSAKQVTGLQATGDEDINVRVSFLMGDYNTIDVSELSPQLVFGKVNRYTEDKVFPLKEGLNVVKGPGSAPVNLYVKFEAPAQYRVPPNVQAFVEISGSQVSQTPTYRLFETTLAEFKNTVMDTTKSIVEIVTPNIHLNVEGWVFRKYYNYNWTSKEIPNLFVTLLEQEFVIALQDQVAGIRRFDDSAHHRRGSPYSLVLFACYYGGSPRPLFFDDYALWVSNEGYLLPSSHVESNDDFASTNAHVLSPSDFSIGELKNPLHSVLLDRVAEYRKNNLKHSISYKVSSEEYQKIRDTFLVQQLPYETADETLESLTGVPADTVRSVMWDQLSVVFGQEELFHRMFRISREDAKAGETDDEHKASLILTASKALNYSMLPFFDAWGIVPESSEVLLNLKYDISQLDVVSYDTSVWSLIDPEAASKDPTYDCAPGGSPFQQCGQTPDGLAKGDISTITRPIGFEESLLTHYLDPRDIRFYGVREVGPYVIFAEDLKFEHDESIPHPESVYNVHAEQYGRLYPVMLGDELCPEDFQILSAQGLSNVIVALRELMEQEYPHVTFTNEDVVEAMKGTLDRSGNPTGLWQAPYHLQHLNNSKYTNFVRLNMFPAGLYNAKNHSYKAGVVPGTHAALPWGNQAKADIMGSTDNYIGRIDLDGTYDYAPVRCFKKSA